MQDNYMPKNEKRILILSNACFSDSDSNGRTLRLLFRGYSPENLAQFFVYGTPDFTACDHYYRVSDRDAMNSFLRGREYGKAIARQNEEAFMKNENVSAGKKEKNIRKKIRKTPLSMLAREIVWKLGKWNGESLSAWIDEFKPNEVFISIADNTFLIRLAIEIVQKYGIPLYVYSTESYCFKNYNYVTKRPSLFYEFFYAWLKSAYRKAEPHVTLGIFNTPLLMDTYGKHYAYPCKCVFSPSNIDFIENSELQGKVRVSYLGNLGVGRHAALVELADVLGQICSGAKLDIYGKLPENQEEKAKILDCANIVYKGFVDYQEVVRVIHESTLLVHAELNDEFYSKDLKYAFSTKIADSVCSGTPFLIYARRDLAETDFLIRNECAFVASDREELNRVLSTALSDIQERKRIVRNARVARERFFGSEGGIKDLIES